MTQNYPKVQGPQQPVWIPDGVMITNNTMGAVPTSLPATTYDAFGRQRVSNPGTLFESSHVLSAKSLFWDTSTANGATTTHTPNRASVYLSVDGTSGSKAVRQSHGYVRYQPGKSQQILATFVMGAAAANLRRRVGYFDENDGVFLEQTSEGLFLVLRTGISGTPSDTNRVAQADWNLDSLTGAGGSGITLDITKSQIFMTDLEWLGVGSVRVGFIINGAFYYVHQFNNANLNASVYMRTGSLPVRYEIENTGVGTAATLEQICASVNSEGGRQPQNLVFNYTMLTSRAVSNADLPVLSIRVADAFPAGGSIVNREMVIPLGVDVYSEDTPIRWQLYYRGTLTNPSWQNFNTTHSGVQYDVSATAITGGVPLQGGLVPTSASTKIAQTISISSDLVMALGIAGAQVDTLSVVCQRLTAVNSDVFAGLTWAEFY